MKFPPFALLLVILLVGVTSHAQSQIPKPTIVHNDDFISSLLDKVSYTALKSVKYTTVSKPAKVVGVREVCFTSGGNKFVFYVSKYNTFQK